MVTTRDEAPARPLCGGSARTASAGTRRRTDEGAWYHEQHDLGFNYRLSDVHSALGLLADGRGWTSSSPRRNAVADRYREGAATSSTRSRCRPRRPTGGRHALPPVRDPPPRRRRRRRALYDALRAAGILAQVHYLPVYRHPYYRETLRLRAQGCAPRPRATTRGCLSLPCFPVLTEADQDRVIEAVKEAAAMSLPAEFDIGGQPVGARAPDLRDRRDRRQPQPRHGHRARADRRRRRGGRRRGQVPDLLRASASTRARRRRFDYLEGSPTSRPPTCSRRSRCRATGRRRWPTHARSQRRAVLLQPVRPRGGRSSWTSSTCRR